jgi:UDP-2,3-diacylglucosamine hydrolase
MSDSLFISDLHLSAERPATLRLFLRFLTEIAASADRLYILGDLFDVWLGDDDQSPPIPEVIAALNDLAAGGTEIYLLHGNRDFLIGEQFCRQSGCKLLPDPTVIELAGEPLLLMHGDLLCSNDHAYQEARRHLRSEEFCREFLAKPLAERALFAAEARRKSDATTATLAEETMDVDEDAVMQQMLHHGASVLIHGHTHRPESHEFLLQGEPAVRIVLDEWHDDGGSYLCVNEQGLHTNQFH